MSDKSGFTVAALIRRSIQGALVCASVLAFLAGQAKAERSLCAWAIGDQPSLMTYEVEGTHILTDQTGVMKDAFAVVRNDQFALVGIHSDMVSIDPKDGDFLGVSMFVVDKLNGVALLAMTFSRGSSPPPIRGTCKRV